MQNNDIQEIDLSYFENASSEFFLTENDFLVGEKLNILRDRISQLFKVNSVVFAICKEGHLELELNMSPFVFSKNNFILLIPGNLAKIKYISPDFKCLYIVSSKDFIYDLISSIYKLAYFFYLRSNPIISLSDEQLSLYDNYINLLIFRSKDKSINYNRDVLRCIVKAMIYDSYSILDQKSIVNRSYSKKEELCINFLSLVSEHFKEEKKLQFYSQKLAVSSKYLSHVLNSITHKTASEWIDTYLLMEAKVLLSSSDLSIKEISANLGFPNQSFFGKFFRRFTKISPLRYRKNIYANK